MNRDVIERDGRRFVLVPEETYDRMIEDLDDLDDIRAYDRAKAGTDDFVPAAVVDRLIAGESAIKVWREHRGLTQQQLADRAQISTPFLSQLEGRKREPSLDTIRRIAAALMLDIDDLVETPHP